MNTRFTIAPNDELKMPASKYINRFQLLGYDGMDPSKFLAQLWGMFGKPQSIGFEGFTYQIQDSNTGIIFQAYSAGSGPAYCFSECDKPHADEIIKNLEIELAKSELPDFEVKYKNDFGSVTIGCKDGKTYEKQE